jgi:hypothetical protein
MKHPTSRKIMEADWGLLLAVLGFVAVLLLIGFAVR